jgi:hypothetical protein
MRHYLLAAVTIVLTSSLASAGSEPAPGAVGLVNQRLVQPLVAKEREQSKFSRARPAPAERRVRLLDEKPQQDSAGEAFLTFAIDTRHGWGDEEDVHWTKAAITGCVYPDRGEVFIKRGKAFHPAAAALGKKTKAAPERTCQAAAQVSAR